MAPLIGSLGRSLPFINAWDPMKGCAGLAESGLDADGDDGSPGRVYGGGSAVRRGEDLEEHVVHVGEGLDIDYS